MLSLPHGIAQGVALVLDCGWIKGLGRLFLQLLPLVLPINTWSLFTYLLCQQRIMQNTPGRQGWNHHLAAKGPRRQGLFSLASTFDFSRVLPEKTWNLTLIHHLAASTDHPHFWFLRYLLLGWNVRDTIKMNKHEDKGMIFTFPGFPLMILLFSMKCKGYHPHDSVLDGMSLLVFMWYCFSYELVWCHNIK